MPAMVNYTITLDGQTLTITDGTNTVTAAARLGLFRLRVYR